MFDVAKAADFFRYRRKSDSKVVIVRRQRGEHLVEHGFVVFDQLAFGAAFLRAAERIERRAAQEFQLRQQSERRQ